MFYPADAPVPETLRTDEFLLRPLRATDVQLDYEAVISSRDVALAYLLEPNRVTTTPDE